MRPIGVAIALSLALASGAAFAQQSGEIELEELQIGPKGKGSALIRDAKGFHHHCEARETAEAVEIGPCKPVVMREEQPEKKRAEVPNRQDFSRDRIVDLFERNDCSLTYAQLKQAIESLGARQREVIGRKIAEMTEAGEIVDDAARERATLKAGRCR